MGFRQMRPEGGGGAAVRRAGLQLHVPRPGRRLQRGRLQEAVRLVRRRRRDGPRLPHRGRGGGGRALRELGRRGDGRPIRGPRPEKVSARFLSPPPTRGLNKEPRLVVSTPTEENIWVFFRRAAAAAGGLNEELRTRSLDTYSGNGVFFSYLSEHWIIEEFRDRNVLGQPLASASLYHELARQMRRRRRFEGM